MAMGGSSCPWGAAGALGQRGILGSGLHHGAICEQERKKPGVISTIIGVLQLPDLLCGE